MIDTLITHGNVLTMNDTLEEISDGAIAIHHGKIVDIGDSAVLDRKYSAMSYVNAAGGIIMPGLINGHCHAAMSLFRGYAENRPLDKFLECVWDAEAKYIDRKSVETGAFLSCVEMAKAGITTFVDMYWFPDDTLAAAQSVGINLMTGPVFVTFPGVDNLPTWQDRLANLDVFCETHASKEGVYLSIAPHSCYALSEQQLADLADISRTRQLRVQIHAAEAPSEMADVQEAYQATPIEVLARTGLLSERCTIAHGVHLSDTDIELMKAAGAAMVHCPISNAKTAAGIARASELREKGIAVGLGTDGPSTGNDLDLWKVMRFASMMQALKYQDPTAIGNSDIIAMATRDGARAIGLGDITGSLEVGKQADVIIVAVDSPHMQPIYDPYSALVFSAGRDDVCDVFVRGKHIVKNTHLDTPQRAAQEQTFKAVTDEIRAKMKA